jgi:hypothetical protein
MVKATTKMKSLLRPKNLNEATALAAWMDAAFRAYLFSEEYVSIRAPQSSDWDSGQRVRVSYLGRCPKRNAAERRFGVEETVEFKRMLRMEDGIRRGRLVAEAIYWAADENNLPVQLEKRYVNEPPALSGTIDVAILFEDGVTPVEIKLTGGNFMRSPRGIEPRHVLQVIGQMQLTGSPFGFLFATHDYNAPETHQVWVVRETPKGWDLWLDGQPATFAPGQDAIVYTRWPVDGDAFVFFARDGVQSLIDNLNWYMQADEAEVLAARPLAYPGHGQCGYYSDKYHRFQPTCPLFSTCFPEVKALGYTDESDTIHVSKSEDGVVFVAVE